LIHAHLEFDKKILQEKAEKATKQKEEKKKKPKPEELEGMPQHQHCPLAKHIEFVNYNLFLTTTSKPVLHNMKLFVSSLPTDAFLSSHPIHSCIIFLGFQFTADFAVTDTNFSSVRSLRSWPPLSYTMLQCKSVFDWILGLLNS
jgi:hypothetical protein